MPYAAAQLHDAIALVDDLLLEFEEQLPHHALLKGADNGAWHGDGAPLHDAAPVGPGAVGQVQLPCVDAGCTCADGQGGLCRGRHCHKWLTSPVSGPASPCAGNAQQ